MKIIKGIKKICEFVKNHFELVAVLIILACFISAFCVNLVSRLDQTQLENSYIAKLNEQSESYEKKISSLSSELKKTDAELKSTTKKYKALKAEVESTGTESVQETYEVSQQNSANEVSVQQVLAPKQTEQKTSSKKQSKKTSDNSGASSSKGTYAGNFTITYYCGENYPHICGSGNGVTASGAKATVGVTIAADPSVLPIGTRVYIEGIGERVVQDTGGGVIGNHIDVFVATHAEAMSNGRHTANVYIL